MDPRKSTASIEEIERRPVSKYAEIYDSALTQHPQNGRPRLAAGDIHPQSHRVSALNLS